MILFAIATWFAIVSLMFLILSVGEAAKQQRARLESAHTRIDFLWDELKVHDSIRLNLERRIVELEAAIEEMTDAGERPCGFGRVKARLDLVEAKAEKTRAAYQSFADRMKNLKPF